MSICPISFNWKQILEPHVIQVEPSFGEIGKKISISNKIQKFRFFFINLFCYNFFPYHL